MELIATPNPNAKKIEIEHALVVGTVINSVKEADDQICSLLIEISGISSIFAGPGFLTLTKDEGKDWESINDDIVAQFDKL